MADVSREVLIAALDPDGWVETAVEGMREKVLYERAPGDASMALLRFARGAGVAASHVHASNQFMFCLEGRYAYPDSDMVLEPGSFYWNPVGNAHGPTEALEESVLLEVYDGRHYPAAADPADETLDRVGTALLHENPLVRIWEVRLEPSESVPWHHHRFPYVVVTVDAGRSKITDRASGEARFGDGEAGSVVFDPGGATHMLTNVGSVPIADRLIEFVASPARVRPARVRVGASPDAGPK